MPVLRHGNYEAMFKLFENIFKFKLTWKSRLKFFYFIAKFHALAHFIYVEKKNKVRHCFLSTVYGWVWVVGYFMLLLFFLSTLNELVEGSNRSAVLFFVNAIEVITVFLKAFTIYFLQVIQSKNLVLLINSAIDIDRMIDANHLKSVDCYSHHRYTRLYNFKKRCILVQCSVLFVSYCFFVVQAGYKTMYIIFGTLVIYAHFTTVVISGLYFYGLLLFGYEFYYTLNAKLIQILKEIEVNKKSRTQIGKSYDELDKISLVYTRISRYVSRINKFFAIQVTFELVGSLILITSVVSINGKITKQKL